MTRYDVQPDRSAVEVLGRSSLRPFRGAAPVAGHIDAQAQDGRLDLALECVGVLRLQVHDLRGDFPHLDRELRNRLDSDRYPVIRAELTEVVEVADGGYRMSGKLTLHGRTQLVSGEATVVFDSHGRLVMSGALKLDVRDFGLIPPKLLMIRMHPQVEVRLGLVAAPAEVAAETVGGGEY